MFLAHKIELRPTKEQEQYLRKCCGISRMVYNMCLFKSKESKWNKKEMLSYLKKIKEEHTFIGDVSSRISRNAIEDLENSYKRFFNKLSKFPKFKRIQSEISKLRKVLKYEIFNKINRRKRRRVLSRRCRVILENL